MTVLHSGSTKAFASGWENIFGGRKSRVASKKKSPKKKQAARPAKAAKKSKKSKPKSAAKKPVLKKKK